jgi:outer membrane protein
LRNASFVLNIVLAVAIAYLYFLHFSGKPDVNSPVAGTITGAPEFHSKLQPNSIRPSKIVFVNSDTLLGKYEYVKDLRKEAESKQYQLENAYKAKGMKLQQDYADLQQKAGQGKITSDQAKAEEEGLMKRKAELDAMEKQLGDLAEDAQKKNVILQNKISQYLKDYNKKGQYNYILSYSSLGGSVLLGSDSLDITYEILNALNEQYKAEKGNQKNGNR